MRLPTSPLLAGVLAVAVTGCSLLQARTDPTRFYVLAAVVDVPPPAPTGLTLGLGPIALPRYLQQPQLATRVGPNEVRFTEFSRWAGPLPTQVATTLADDLRGALGTERLVLYPWYAGTGLDVVVEVDVTRFEPDQDGQVHLVARWRIKDGTATTLLRAGDADVREPAGAVGVDAVVAALSRALGQLGREIAAAVRATHPSVHP
jgi:hypothetical protein